MLLVAFCAPSPCAVFLCCTGGKERDVAALVVVGAADVATVIVVCSCFCCYCRFCCCCYGVDDNPLFLLDETKHTLVHSSYSL